MTATYDCIATTTLGSNTASVTFSSISGTYTDLFLLVVFGTSTSDYLKLTFNSDTTMSNDSGTYLSGSGSSASSGRYTSTSSPEYWLGGAISADTNAYGTIAKININNYSNTTTYKTVIARLDRASSTGGTAGVVGLWRNTAAITSLTLSVVNGAYNLVSGSTFSLYGIKSE